MNVRTVIEGLLAKGWKPAGLARHLDVSEQALYALRWNRAEPSRETARRLRQLAGMVPPVRHAPGCPVRYGR